MYESTARQPGESPAAAALRGLREAVDRVAELDLNGESDRELLDAMLSLQQQANRIDGQRVRILSAIDDRGAHREDACVTAGSWLRFKANLDYAPTARLAEAGRRLKRLPELEAALQAGDTSLAHVLNVTAAANSGPRSDAIASCDAALAQLARSASPQHVKVAVRRIRDAIDPDGSDPQPAHLDDAGHDTRRSCEQFRVGELGHAQQVMDAETSDLLADLLDAYSEPDPPGTPSEQRRTPTQRRADAFARILAAAATVVGAPTVHGARPSANLTVDLATVMGADQLATHRPRLRHFGEVDGDTARRIVQRAKVQVILTMGPWRVTHVGRRFRTLPPWLRGCIEAMHRHCRGPGCDRPITWAQMMHQTDWAAGGDTSVAETLPGCQAHHDFLTTQGWQWQADFDSGEVTWLGPKGQSITVTNPNAATVAAA